MAVNVKKNMRKIIGNIIYKRDIYCGFVGYTDESWVWIVRSKKEKVLISSEYVLKGHVHVTVIFFSLKDLYLHPVSQKS